MPKLKDFLLEMNKTLANNEIVAIAGASGIAEIEVGDETMTEIKTKMGGLMSLDAAKNNHDLEDHFKKKVYGTIKGELLGNIDTDLLNSAKTILGDESVDKFKDIEFTGDKIKKFTELTSLLVKDLVENKDGGDEKIKTLNAGLNKQVADLTANIDKAEKAKDKEIKKLQIGFDEKLIEKEFTATFNTYNLGDKYQEDFFKSSLREKIRKDVQGVAKLTLSEKGDVIPKNPENIGMELFIQNKPVDTLKGVMDPLMADFIKVNNVKDKNLKDDYVPAKDVKMSKQAQDLIDRRKESFSI